jgi:hypothetical protein
MRKKVLKELKQRQQYSGARLFIVFVAFHTTLYSLVVRVLDAIERAGERERRKGKKNNINELYQGCGVNEF